MSDEKNQSRPTPATRDHRLWTRLAGVAFSFFGGSDRQAAPPPVVRRHDDVENETNFQLDDIDVETDAEGHHYGVQRHEFRPVQGLQGNTYPYYGGRPPLNAPET